MGSKRTFRSRYFCASFETNIVLIRGGPFVCGPVRSALWGPALGYEKNTIATLFKEGLPHLNQLGLLGTNDFMQDCSSYSTFWPGPTWSNSVQAPNWDKSE